MTWVCEGHSFWGLFVSEFPGPTLLEGKPSSPWIRRFVEKVSGLSLNRKHLWGNNDIVEAFLEKHTMADLIGIMEKPLPLSWWMLKPSLKSSARKLSSQPFPPASLHPPPPSAILVICCISFPELLQLSLYKTAHIYSLTVLGARSLKLRWQ